MQESILVEIFITLWAGRLPVNFMQLVLDVLTYDGHQSNNLAIKNSNLCHVELSR